MAPNTAASLEANLPNQQASRDQIHRIQSSLNLSDFTPLADHQSQTPSSFYSGPPVLHHICHNTSLRISTRDIASIPYFTNYAQQPVTPTAHNEGASTAEFVEVRGVDVWITSENLKFAFPEQRSEPGYIAIPYPLIVLHANQPASATAPGCLYLQIRVVGDGPHDDDDDDDDDPYRTFTLLVVPPDVASGSSPAIAPPSPPAEPIPSAGEIQKMYDALTNCSNLYPDRGDDNGEAMDLEGAEPIWITGNRNGNTNLPPPMPGSGGWITADNIADYFDADGNPRACSNPSNTNHSPTPPTNGLRIENGTGHHRTDLPPPMPGSGGWITAENVDTFFDEEGSLGAGAGTVRVRERDEEEESGDGDGEGSSRGDGDGETKWRRIE